MNTVKLATGVRLPYVEQGSVAGEPVIFLHGITDSLHSYDLVMPYLPASVRAFAVTQRGHGEAERPVTGYKSVDFADDTAAFMDVLNIEKAVIAGHSMGSINALTFALKYPERVKGLILMGAFNNLRDNPDIQGFFQTAIAPLTDPIDRSVAVEFQQSTLAQPVPSYYFEKVVGESLKVPARVWKAAFESLLQVDFTDELNKVKAPTLIVWGDQDAFSPRSDQEILNEGIANSQLLVYQGAGHAFHWEEPARFAADVVTFTQTRL
jgi:non-heme chloroperoxidase